jgi:hypothetical protein
VVGKQQCRRFADDRRLLVPVQAAGAVVPAGHGRGVVDAEDGVVRGVED